MQHNSSSKHLTPLLTTLVLPGGCSDDSAGNLSDVAPSSSGGLESTTDAASSTSTLPAPTTDPFVTGTTADGMTTADGTTTTGDGTTTTGDGTTTTGDDTTTTGDGTTGCEMGDPLCELPPEEQVPTPKPDGVPSPLPGVYDDSYAAIWSMGQLCCPQICRKTRTFESADVLAVCHTRLPLGPLDARSADIHRAYRMSNLSFFSAPHA